MPCYGGDVDKNKMKKSKIFNKIVKDNYDVKLKGGFRSYTKSYIFVLDSLSIEFLNSHIQKFLYTLKPGTFYTMLALGCIKDDDDPEYTR